MFYPAFTILFTIFHLIAAVKHPVERRASINDPTSDPFYIPPNGWRDAKPGDVLRARKVDLAFLQVARISHQTAYQILYRTTGAEENLPSHSVTTVIIPENAKRDRLVNYLVYTDSNGAKCAPSYSMRKGGDLGVDLALNYQQILFSSFLNEGYILAIPDYQGPQRAFAAARLEGRQALDGARAALNYERIGLRKRTKVVMYGYSGGAIASGWAAALHSTYAPEINAVGFGMGGTPANISSTVESLDGGLFSGFGLAGVVGIVFAYKKVQEWAKDRITKKGHEAIEFARNHCMLDVLLTYPFSKLISNEFVEGASRILYDPTIRSVVGDMVLGLKKIETPKAPVYMFHGKHDEVIPFKDAFKSGKQWVKHGGNVLFEEYTDLTSGHLFTEILNIPNVVLFVQERFNNKPFPRGFHHKTYGNALEDPRIFTLGNHKALVKEIQFKIDKDIGLGDSKLKNRIKKHGKR